MSNRYLALQDRALLRFSGKDARHFLQGLITQNIHNITPTNSAYSLLLNAQGKFLFDFFLIADGDGILMEVGDARLDHLKHLLTMYRLRADVQINDLTANYHILAVIGNTAALSLADGEGRTEHDPDSGVFEFIDPRHAPMGARIIAPNGQGENLLQQRGFAQMTPEAYTAHRLSLGIPEGDPDNRPEKTLPLENGLDRLHGIDFEKGCYVGQEVTARTHYRANLRKRLYKVKARDGLPEPGTPVMLGERAAGTLFSTLGKTGLALLRMDAVESAERLTADGVELQASLPPWNKREA